MQFPIMHIAILLGILPLIKFILVRYYSKKEKRLKIFKKNKTDYLYDWLFVPFNFLVALIANLQIKIISLFLLLCFIISLYFHKVYWPKVHPASHFLKKKGKLSKSGFVHHIYSSIQATIILTFLFSNASGGLVITSSLILATFLILLSYNSKKLHGKILAGDLILSISGIAILLTKNIIL